LLDSLTADEPFWAARGRRGFLESLSTEEPFWAARGKKESSQVASPSPEELLSQVSALNDSVSRGTAVPVSALNGSVSRGTVVLGKCTE
jgi:uncharacterized membrane protein